MLPKNWQIGAPSPTRFHPHIPVAIGTAVLPLAANGRGTAVPLPTQGTSSPGVPNNMVPPRRLASGPFPVKLRRLSMRDDAVHHPGRLRQFSVERPRLAFVAVLVGVHYGAQRRIFHLIYPTSSASSSGSAALGDGGIPRRQRHRRPSDGRAPPRTEVGRGPTRPMDGDALCAR